MRRASLAALVLGALTASASAQPPQRNFRYDGTEAFRAVVASYKVTPLANARELTKEPERTLLISFRGERQGSVLSDDALDNLPIKGGLKAFIELGGAVLVATDVKTGEWADEFNVSVTGIKVIADAGSRPYRGNQYDCPYVVGVSDSVPDLFFRGERRNAHPFIGQRRGKRLDLVATNRPSYLRRATFRRPIELLTLATFQPFCHFEQIGLPLPWDTAFAQGKRYPGGGRILVLADHSVFINSMLMPPDQDNDNLEFTFNCLNWLTDGLGNERRDRVLFIDDGTIVTDFNLLLRESPPPPPPSPEDILDFLWKNRDKASPLVAQMEDKQVFRRLEGAEVLRQRPEDADVEPSPIDWQGGGPFNRFLLDWVPHWVIVRFILILGMAVLFGYGILRLFASKHAFRKYIPRLTVALERFRPRTGMLDQRLRGALRAGQYYEAARVKAQREFAGLGLEPAPEGLPPQFAIDGNWFQRRHWEAELREIWQIAYGADPIPVSARKWDKWQQRLYALADQIRKGRIRFES